MSSDHTGTALSTFRIIADEVLQLCRYALCGRTSWWWKTDVCLIFLPDDGLHVSGCGLSCTFKTDGVMLTCSGFGLCPTERPLPNRSLAVSGNGSSTCNTMVATSSGLFAQVHAMGTAVRSTALLACLLKVMGTMHSALFMELCSSPQKFLFPFEVLIPPDGSILRILKLHRRVLGLQDGKGAPELVRHECEGKRLSDQAIHCSLFLQQQPHGSVITESMMSQEVENAKGHDNVAVANADADAAKMTKTCCMQVVHQAESSKDLRCSATGLTGGSVASSER